MLRILVGRRDGCTLVFAMRRSRSIGVTAFACLALCVALGAGAQEEGARAGTVETATVLADWTRRLKTAATDLRESRFERARLATDAVLREMLDQIESGDGAGALLALPVVLRGIAESGLGHSDDALWDWQTAVALNPDVQRLSVADYGEAGQRLMERAQADAVSGERAGEVRRAQGGGPIEPPVKITSPDIVYPAAARSSCRHGDLVVRVRLDPDGVLRRPRVQRDPGSAALLVAGLEALRRTRYQPASRGGVPVAVSLVTTLRFQIPGCPSGTTPPN